VVDACAGAGGRRWRWGAALAGKGRVLALDTDGKKLEELRRRAPPCRADQCAGDAGGGGGGRRREGGPGRARSRAGGRPLLGAGDAAPQPEARWRLTRAAVDAFPARQLGLLIRYAPLTAVGGRVIYATCTVNRRENEGVVERFLAERNDFVPVPVKEIWGRERAEKLGDGMTLQLFPHRHDTDGFFAAVLRRVR
jgi:16S rRNA (cytosine967-C5)-methyltransferase